MSIRTAYPDIGVAEISTPRFTPSKPVSEVPRSRSWVPPAGEQGRQADVRLAQLVAGPLPAPVPENVAG
jgi:hypothetical protein